MARNKNQHYVPRVYLRHFTIERNGLAINLFNFNRMKVIQNAAVKHQCSGDYFYGWDNDLEKAINFVENKYGECMKHLAQENLIIGPIEHVVLRKFIYLQHLRTEEASRSASEMTLSMLDLPGSDIPIPSKREAQKAAVQSAMLHFAESMDIIDDLKLCIVRNRTNRPFITSDNPAILTNRLIIQRSRKSDCRFGAKTAGAIFILPLTQDLCALLYDGDVYTVSKQDHWVDVERVSDIEAINDHQLLNCMDNVYFCNWSSRDWIADRARSVQSFRPERKHTVTHAVLDSTTEWGFRYLVKPLPNIMDEEEVLVHVMKNHPCPPAWPSFLRFRLDGRAYSNNTRAGLTRRWCLERGFIRGIGYRKVRI
ncbi:DUF4238 domain-containing protein [Azospirillum sp. HJ39]|uniref:DUF4238 domain-containing protein n=1 Tax=Azospirillum sp. HJ39 TaxID=3159496 RepID=UPI003556F5D2